MTGPLRVDVAEVRRALAGLTDPELPAITLVDLGVLRGVEVDGDRVVVTLTPTYSGCPATAAIEDDVRTALVARGWTPEVRTVLSPAWSTDDITERGRQALLADGIAPPGPRPAGPVSLPLPRPRPACPQCGSAQTEELSRFGASACRALWRCTTCREPFDHLRAH